MKKIRAILLLHLVFFIGWAVIEEFRLVNPSPIVLKTAPVDPRDFISGYYMALNYDINDASNLPGFDRNFIAGAGDFYVYLRPTEKITINKIEQTVYSAVSVSYASELPHKSPPGVWAKGIYNKNTNTIKYGIEKYYFSEKRKTELNKLRSGKFYVAINIDKSGVMRVKDLIIPDTE